MTVLLIPLAVAAASALVHALARTVRDDGYGHRPPPRSHPADDVVTASNA